MTVYEQIMERHKGFWHETPNKLMLIAEAAFHGYSVKSSDSEGCFKVLHTSEVTELDTQIGQDANRSVAWDIAIQHYSESKHKAEIL